LHDVRCMLLLLVLLGLLVWLLGQLHPTLCMLLLLLVLLVRLLGWLHPTHCILLLLQLLLLALRLLLESMVLRLGQSGRRLNGGPALNGTLLCARCEGSCHSPLHGR